MCRFFDTNPSGRILNRFSSDVTAIDQVGETSQSSLTPLISLRSIYIYRKRQQGAISFSTWIDSVKTSFKPPKKFRLSLNPGISKHKYFSHLFLTILLMHPPKFIHSVPFLQKGAGLQGAISFVYNLKDFTSNSIHMTKEDYSLLSLFVEMILSELRRVSRICLVYYYQFKE